MTNADAERILAASPPVEAIGACPYTVDELDTLTNSARVWATIQVLKQSLSERENAAEDDMAALKHRVRDRVATVVSRFDAFCVEPSNENEVEVLEAVETLEREVDD